MTRALCKYFVCLAPFWLYIFDLTMSLAGIKYMGIEDSNSLVVAALLVGAGVGAIYLLSLIRSMRIYVEELCFFAAVIIFLPFIWLPVTACGATRLR